MSVQPLTKGNQAFGKDKLALEEHEQDDKQKAPFMLLNEEVSTETQQKIDALQAILQAPDKRNRQQAIAQASETIDLLHNSIMPKGWKPWATTDT